MRARSSAWPKRKGISLIAALMILTASMTFVSALLGVAWFQTDASLYYLTRASALNAADSAASAAIARLLDTALSFGTAGESLQLTTADGSVGIVTFAAGQSYSSNNRVIPLAWSLQNYQALNPPPPRPGFRRTVPSQVVQIVGNGIGTGGMCRRLEVLLHFPPFQYAIASQGPLQLNQSVIAGINSKTVLPLDANGLPIVDPATLSSGNVVSDTRMALDASVVKGDARSAGDISLVQSQIIGSVDRNAAPLTLPDIDLSQYDPSGQVPTRELPAAPLDTTLSGSSHRSGDLIFDSDLTLDNAILYVTGNLTIHGGLKGSGIVAVAGNTTIQGSTTLDAPGLDKAALLCNGDVTIGGGAVFQGTVYTHGSFTASHIVLIGCFISKGAPPSSTTLTGVNVLYNPANVDVSIFRDAAFMMDPVCSIANYPYIDPATLAIKDPNLPLDAQPWIWSQSFPQYSGTMSLLQNPNTDLSTSTMPLLAALDPQPPPSTGLDFTYFYTNIHQLGMISKRDGQLVYTLMDRLRTPDGLSDLSPPLRTLLPNSPWQTLPLTGHPYQYVSILETHKLQDILDNLPTSPLPPPGSLTKNVLLPSFVSYEFNKALTFNVPAVAAAQGVNWQYSPNRYMSPDDMVREFLWREIP